MNRFEDISNDELTKLIDNWIKSERDRKILKRRLIDGITYEAIGEEAGLTVDRIKQIVYKQQNKLFSHIPEAEYIAGELWYPITQ